MAQILGSFKVAFCCDVVFKPFVFVFYALSFNVIFNKCHLWKYIWLSDFGIEILETYWQNILNRCSRLDFLTLTFCLSLILFWRKSARSYDLLLLVNFLHSSNQLCDVSKACLNIPILHSTWGLLTPWSKSKRQVVLTSELVSNMRSWLRS